MTVTGNVRRAVVVLACSLFPLALHGCGSSEPRPASSGDPEADRRAELRVGSDDGKAKPGTTLYQRLGGAAGIDALVDDMTARVIADPRVNFERNEVSTSWVGTHYKPWQATPANVEHFKARMREFLALATGGPAEYSGRDMRSAHRGMRITNTEFDAMVGDIKTSMDRLGTGAKEKRDLLAIIETTRKEVVEK